MRGVAALLVAVAALAGCASAGSNGWTKPGVTAEQLERDRSDCLLQARQVVPGADGPRMKMDYPRYERCMAQRGYTAAAK
jgi:hypothetical protein